MSERPTIVLFDIDGTLVSTGALARAAMEQAVSEQWGDAATFGFSYAGMTDLGIFRRGLDAMGVTFDRALVDQVLQRYLQLLSAHLAGDPRHQCFEGASQVVSAVAARPNVAAGLGTGNVEAGARIKLRPFGLNELLPFGGFGDDAEARADVIAAGVERGARLLGRRPTDCALVIVGDTAADVAAAKANGGACVGVANGSASAETLLSYGADVAFSDLAQPGVADAILAVAR